MREQHVYAEIVPWNAPLARIEALSPKGLILSGGPNSVYDDGAPTLSPAVEALNVPVLGICYGLHLLAHALGGQVVPGDAREYGPADVDIAATDTPLFAGLASRQAVWMSHGDRIEVLPPGFRELARSTGGILAAIGSRRATHLRRAVSPRSAAHAQRRRDATSFSHRYLWM